MLVNIVVVIQILAALTMAGLVLVQHGKGADMGAAFGSGSAGSLFGASGSANFLSRMTAVAATVFFISTLALAFFAGDAIRQPVAPGGSVLESAPFTNPVSESAPVSAIPGTADAITPQSADIPVPAQIPAQVEGVVPAETEATPAKVEAEQSAEVQENAEGQASSSAESGATGK